MKSVSESRLHRGTQSQPFCNCGWQIILDHRPEIGRDGQAHGSIPGQNSLSARSTGDDAGRFKVPID